MNTKYFVIVAAMTAVLIGSTTLAAADSASATKYDKNQAISQANVCGNGKLPLNIGCQNVDSQIQGDENVVSQAAGQAFGEFEDDNSGMFATE